MKSFKWVLVWVILVLGVNLNLFAGSYDNFQKTLQLKKGWNLVSLPISTQMDSSQILDKFSTNIKSLWKYNQGWELISSDTDLLSKANQLHVKKMQSLSPQDGFWINSATDQNITFAGSEFLINYDFLHSGWNLLGTGVDIVDLNATFPNSSIIWAYLGNWLAYSPNKSISKVLSSKGITTITSLKAGQGFWVNQNKLTYKNKVALGLISDADINAYRIDDTSSVIATSKSNLNYDFNMTIPSGDYWTMLTAENGNVNDSDFDGVKDGSIANSSKIHVLLKSTDANSGIIFNRLGELSYQIIKERLADYNSTYTPQSDLDTIASYFFSDDIDGDGNIDYKDILHFDISKASNIKALKISMSAFDSKLDDNTTLNEKISGNVAISQADIVKVFSKDIIPPRPVEFINAVVTLDVPTNKDGIVQADVKVSSLASDNLKVYKNRTTMLMAEDDDNNTLMLGYAIPSTLQNTLMRMRGLKRASVLYKTNPSDIEISPRSTALSLTMMMLQSGLSEDQKTQLAAVVLSDSKFETLRQMIEAAFKADSKFLDTLMLNKDIVNMIRETAISAWKEYSGIDVSQTKSGLTRVLHRTGPNIDWGWVDDTLWYWYGEASMDPLDLSGAPFIATAYNGAKVSLANPTLKNYIVTYYDNMGKELKWIISPRNSTLLQKVINKGAIGRVIPTNPNIAYLEYKNSAFSKGLNTWHIATSVLNTVGDASFLKPIDKVLGKYSTAICVLAIFDSIDYANGQSVSDTVHQMFLMNWPSAFETATNCLLNSDFVKQTLKDEIKKIPEKAGRLSATIVAKTSNVVGWIWIAANALNGPIPVTTSIIFAPAYAGYDFHWTDGKLSNITTASQPPKAPVLPQAKIDYTQTSAFQWSFDASKSIVDSNSANTQYDWQIDNTNYSGKVVNHTFTSQGKKTITLILKDDFGQVSKSKTTINITDGSAPIISNLQCTVDANDFMKVHISWSATDRDNDIQDIKIYKHALSDLNPQTLSATATSTTIQYPSDPTLVIYIYKPLIKVTDALGHESIQSCVVSGDSNYNFGVNLDKGLIAHYEFEGNANDSSGNGNNGTEHGGVSYVDGVIGKAAKFDGVDDYINVGDKLKMDKYLSIVCWINMVNQASENYGIIVNKEGEYEIAIENNKELKFSIANESPEWGWQNTNIFISNWKMLSFIYDYDNSIIKIYLNDQLLKTYNVLGAIGDRHVDLNDFRIGSRQLNNANFFNGLIDDLRIYNRALNEAEIKELYKMGQQVDLTNGLVAHYEFDNGFANSITGKDDGNKWENSDNIEIDNGYLKLVNNYDVDKKRYTKTTIDTSNINMLTIEKKTKLTTKDNHTLSSTSFQNSYGENISIEYNNYHHNSGDLLHKIDTENTEHFYIFNRWNYVNADNFEYKLSELIEPIWGQWFYEKITIDFENKEIFYQISKDGINYKQVSITNIQFQRDTNTTLQFIAWDWASGSEHYIDYLKFKGN